MEKKVLIITYYWPPSAGSGVQRWLKFVKYLPQYGWIPFVCTPDNPSFGLRDDSLLRDVPPEAEVLRLPIWEPYQLIGRRATGAAAQVLPPARTKWWQRVAAWVRGNFLVPDPRVFWVRPAARFLEDFIHHENISHIITTGPPHSMHLIGLRLKKKLPSLNWLADFRDPWSEWFLLDDLKVTPPVRWVHQRMERKVLTTANTVVTVTPYLAARLAQLSGRKVACITNGYDEDDRWQLPYERTENFTIRHAGILRDATPFLEAVKQAWREQPEMKDLMRIEFIGMVHEEFRRQIEADVALRTSTSFVDYVPHAQLPILYARTDLLLLVIPNVALAKGYLPGKLFEYLASGRPIIGLGPEDGDAAEIVRQAGAGVMANWTNIEKIKHALLDYFNRWKRGENPVTPAAGQFSRRQLTGQLVRLLQAQPLTDVETAAS